MGFTFSEASASNPPMQTHSVNQVGIVARGTQVLRSTDWDKEQVRSHRPDSERTRWMLETINGAQ